MWQTQLISSYRLGLFSTLFYSALAVYGFILCWQYEYRFTSFFILTVLFFEYRRSCRYFSSLCGEFAIDLSVRQVYWQQQRWYITRKPLFLRYWIVVDVKSLRTKKRSRLWLSHDYFSRSDWRSCCYYLHRIADHF